MSSSTLKASTAIGGKRKKHQDRDKYYKLAKEQGYRSRAAFKLIQINKKYGFLQNSKIIIDLCAAPGGWSQVSARNIQRGGIVLSVDLLPIRKIRGVISHVADITTPACHALVRKEMQTSKADTVLCDGAPDLGGTYDRDSYVQNEIVLLSLKCATEHLIKGGTFCTKVYRSKDYNSLLWVLKQLFDNVEAVKPASSRAASAEIFLVCTGYFAPDKIDPKMLDPKYVFEDLEGMGGVGGGDIVKGVSVFSKDYNKHTRSRQGYSEDIDFTMRRIKTVSEYVNSTEPIQMLSDCNAFKFEVKPSEGEDGHDTFIDYKKCKATTTDLLESIMDLKLLGKGEFRQLIQWRLALQTYRDEIVKERSGKTEDEIDDDDEAEFKRKRKEKNDKMGEDEDSEEEEKGILAEIDDLKKQKLRKKKRAVKKLREAAAKLRTRKALGMEHNAMELEAHDDIFSLVTIKNKGDLDKIGEVDLNTVNRKEMKFDIDSDDTDSDDEDDGNGNTSDVVKSDSDSEDEYDEATGYSKRLELELDSAYDVYLKNTRDGFAKAGTKMQKRSKKLRALKAADEVTEDMELMGNMDSEQKAYAKMLSGKRDSDDSDSDEREDGGDSSDDGFFDKESDDDEEKDTKNKKVKDADGRTITSKMQKAMVKADKKAKRKGGGLLVDMDEDESRGVKAERWFSNPIFGEVGVEDGEDEEEEGSGSDDDDDDDDDDDGPDSDEEVEVKVRGRNKKPKKSAGEEVEDLLAAMPKTDKQKRHEKRQLAAQRLSRRDERREKIMGGDGFEVVSGGHSTGTDLSELDDANKADAELLQLDEKARNRVLNARKMIAAGMGLGGKEDAGFEIAKAAPLPVVDDRKYGSDDEDYDSDDHARTLALGTMMLRQSKAKALVDASYNRYAWNDPTDLPDWFVDDENKHYRPQLPIPEALVQKMKEKFLSLAAKPIAKVAEARARKSKRANTQLKAAKKKAEAVASSNEMSESMKLKAISKAMRGNDVGAPSKTYVVASKGAGKNQGSKGVKLVDTRQKKDKRGAKRALNGKSKGALTGGKRRKQHS